jgi:DnaK suppressor protein
MDAPDLDGLLASVEEAQARAERQVAALEQAVAAIVQGAELTSTDDEHDPEGATIAYERAQALALLRQAREDLDALASMRRLLESGEHVRCAVCGDVIDPERLAALPTATRCVRCAS